MLNTSAEIRYRLLGHTDTSIKSHYQNWEWSKLSEQIDTAHLDVLKAFDTEALFNELIDKVSEVTDEVTKDSLRTVHLSND
tara:strand:+ start:643 stop:885 length:243 start_codon:yes stop_codon:yes gene_type:complete